MDDMRSRRPGPGHAHATEFLDGLDRRSVARPPVCPSCAERLGLRSPLKVFRRAMIDELVAAADGVISVRRRRFFAW